MRHPPKWPSPDAKHVWVRVSLVSLDNPKVRGQFILIFDPNDWSLHRIALNRYDHMALPDPDPDSYPQNDIIRDRKAPHLKS
ncbi:MAG: hypothetical protein AAF591_02375 [Verrucomicrobiota bacterium]